MQHLDALMVRVADLRAASLHFLDACSWNGTATGGSGCCDADGNLSAKDIAERARQLDEELVMWAEGADGEWRYKVGNGEDGATWRHEYSSIAHAAVWNRYRALGLIVNDIHLRTLEAGRHCAEGSRSVAEEMETCRKRMEGLAEALCGGIDFFFRQPANLGEGMQGISPKLAWLLAWPMAIAVIVKGVEERRRSWLRERLRSVAEALGDGVLGELVDGGFEF